MASAALALSFALSVIHLFAGRLRFLDVVPRSRWLSFASGMSVAYVFVHLLPELAEGQRHVGESGVAETLAPGSQVWVVALVGLTIFYGLERVAKRSREERAADRAEREVFWLHAASYGLYNIVIGYLLVHRHEAGTASLLLFWAAMALHFFVNDYGLRQHHKDRYRRSGRWVLAAAVPSGTLLGLATSVSDSLLALLIAFLGGGVVLNVLKEELPEDRQSRFLPFAVGAAGYTALLLAF